MVGEFEGFGDLGVFDVLAVQDGGGGFGLTHALVICRSLVELVFGLDEFPLRLLVVLDGDFT